MVKLGKCHLFQLQELNCSRPTRAMRKSGGVRASAVIKSSALTEETREAPQSYWTSSLGAAHVNVKP